MLYRLTRSARVQCSPKTLFQTGKTVTTAPIQMGNAKLTGASDVGSGEAKVTLSKLVPDWYKRASTSTMHFTATPPVMPPMRIETALEGK